MGTLADNQQKLQACCNQLRKMLDQELAEAISVQKLAADIMAEYYLLQCEVPELQRITPEDQATFSRMRTVPNRMQAMLGKLLVTFGRLLTISGSVMRTDGSEAGRVYHANFEETVRAELVDLVQLATVLQAF